MPSANCDTELSLSIAQLESHRLPSQLVVQPEASPRAEQKDWLPWTSRLSPTAESSLRRILRIERINDIYRQVSLCTARTVNTQVARTFIDAMLNSLGISFAISDQDLSRIPQSGSVVVIANHPFGIADGMIMSSLLLSIRPDVKIIANHLLGQVSELNKLFIPVNPFGGKDSTKENAGPLREALRWLKQGGMMGAFPAGEVSHLQSGRRGITDPNWLNTIGRIVRITQASVLPIYFDGCNGPLFQALGLLHSRLRTAMLPRELLNKRGKTIEVRVGNVISAKKIAGFTSDSQLTDYLRGRTYVLKNRMTETVEKQIGPLSTLRSGDLLQAEIDRLPSDQLLVEGREFKVMHANAEQIPGLLNEIGRLREITFKAVGEGTGRAIDLDEFDKYYVHLFVWAKDKKEIVGAYRLGKTDEIISRFGKAGLYTNTLFDYKTGLMEQISPALELGRSFIRKEYQKSHSSLMLLWKGIGQFVVRNPRYRFLFGPVSITNDYQEISRQLMVAFLKEKSYMNDLAKYVKPRNPFRAESVSRLANYAPNLVINDIEEISSLISDIETKQVGIPVLLKQYLRLGGKLLGFNVDRNFSNVLDGLILIDLMQANQDSLEKYFTRSGLESVINYHTAGVAKAS